MAIPRMNYQCTEYEVDYLYLDVAKHLLYPVYSEQVGNTREMMNVTLRLTDITKNIVSVRDLSPSYLFGELLWYFNGDNSLKFISQFSSFWNNISDDGETCNSAYGYLIKYAHGYDQLEKVIEILKDDPNSRRAKININYPNERVDWTKDEPCTMSLHFLIRQGKLHCTAIMRSNDIWFGLPYDIAFFTELQKYIADKLGVGYGMYTHHAVSMHVYDHDIEKLKKIIADPISKPIEFDREKFYRNKKKLFIIAKRGGKEALMEALEQSGIYKEK